MGQVQALWARVALLPSAASCGPLHVPASAPRRGSPSSQMPSSAHLPEHPACMCLVVPSTPTLPPMNQGSRAAGRDMGPELRWAQFTLSCRSHRVSERLWPLRLGLAVGQWGPRWEETPREMGRTWLWTQISCHPWRVPTSGQTNAGAACPLQLFPHLAGELGQPALPCLPGRAKDRVPAVLHHGSPGFLVP